MYNAKEVFMHVMTRPDSAIADHKYHLSQRIGMERRILMACPITVPETVDDILREEQYPNMLQDVEYTSGALRRKLILDYFSSDRLEPVISWTHPDAIVYVGPKPLTVTTVWSSSESVAETQRRAKEMHYESGVWVTRTVGELTRFKAQMFGGNPEYNIDPSKDLVRTYCEWCNIVDLQDRLWQMVSSSPKPHPK